MKKQNKKDAMRIISKRKVLAEEGTIQMAVRGKVFRRIIDGKQMVLISTNYCTRKQLETFYEELNKLGEDDDCNHLTNSCALTYYCLASLWHPKEGEHFKATIGYHKAGNSTDLRIIGVAAIQEIKSDSVKTASQITQELLDVALEDSPLSYTDETMAEILNKELMPSNVQEIDLATLPIPLKAPVV